MAEESEDVTHEGAATAAPSPSSPISGLDLVHLTKEFPGGTVAVEDVNLHVDHGEYVVLLGPSAHSRAVLRPLAAPDHREPVGRAREDEHGPSILVAARNADGQVVVPAGR